MCPMSGNCEPTNKAGARYRNYVITLKITTFAYICPEKRISNQ